MSVWIGTEKQIAWAVKIKDKVLEVAEHEWLMDTCEAYDRDEEITTKALQFVQRLKNIGNASYWINHFKDTRKVQVSQKLTDLFFGD